MKWFHWPVSFFDVPGHSGLRGPDCHSADIVYIYVEVTGDGLLWKYWSYLLAGFCLLWIFYNNFSENNEFKISINSCHFWSVAKFCRCRRWRRRSCFVGQERSSTFSWKTCKRKLIIPIFLNKKDIVFQYKNCCGNSKIQKKKLLFWHKGNHSAIRDISYTLWNCNKVYNFLETLFYVFFNVYMNLF